MDDAEGVRIPNIEAKRAYTIDDIGDLRDMASPFCDDKISWQVEIVGQGGKLVLTLLLSETHQGPPNPDESPPKYQSGQGPAAQIRNVHPAS